MFNYKYKKIFNVLTPNHIFIFQFSIQKMVRKSKGRQKIEMEKMKNETNLQVTFSKRRSGLFKKASELCTLCSAEIAIIVHSPGGKVFSFGHPNVDVVTDRFLRPHHHQHNNMQFSEANRNTVIQNLNDHLTEVNFKSYFFVLRLKKINLIFIKYYKTYRNISIFIVLFQNFFIKSIAYVRNNCFS